MNNIYYKNLQTITRCQKGFTLMEVAIVMVMIAALVGTLASSLWSKQDTLTTQQAVIHFTKTFPQAILNARMNGNNGCFVQSQSSWDNKCGTGVADTMTQALKDGGAPDKTEWGEDWTADNKLGYVRISYGITRLSETEQRNLGKAIADAADLPNSPLMENTLTSSFKTPAVTGDGKVDKGTGGNVYTAKQGTFDADSPTKVYIFIKTR